MDTRSKILGAGDAAEAVRRERASGKSVALVTGYFDPLIADHARRLSEIGAGSDVLVVAIEDPPWPPILPLRARAELVAGLGMVDYVMLPPDNESGRVRVELEADRIFREEAADERRARDLIQHVHERQRSA